MDNRIILDICIYTYNRKEVLISDINSYLQCNDPRFRIVIQDNASTDGTREEIERLNSYKIIYRRNSSNIGALPNAIKALSNNTAEYSMVLIDKDLVQIHELPNFLNYLEKKSPDFGYINLNITKENPTNYYFKGIDAVKHLGFQSIHPSGYFFKSKLWNIAITQKWFKAIPPYFDFPFDCVAGVMAFEHDGVIYGRPLIRYFHLREFYEDTKTITYNEETFFFSPKVIRATMKTYLDCIFATETNNNIKSICVESILNRAIQQSTFQYMHFLGDPVVCKHYGLRQRHISTMNLIEYLNLCIKEFNVATKNKIGSFRRHQIVIKCIIKFLFHTFKICIKRMTS